MKLTKELLAAFERGGQMEFQNPIREYIYRGEVDAVAADESGGITVIFRWLARGVGYPPKPSRWVVDAGQGLAWQGHVSTFSAVDTKDGQIHLVSHMTRQTAVFFPKDHAHNLKPSQVEGLGLPICSAR